VVVVMPGETGKPTTSYHRDNFSTLREDEPKELEADNNLDMSFGQAILGSLIFNKDWA
jgi:hypothetical protein